MTVNWAKLMQYKILNLRLASICISFALTRSHQFLTSPAAPSEPWRMLEATIPGLPDEKPRHLLGVGSPDDLLEGIERGVDMFDCVLPTRTARTGGLYTTRGRLNVRGARYREERGPIDPTCDCWTCRTFSAGYLHHLI